MKDLPRVFANKIDESINNDQELFYGSVRGEDAKDDISVVKKINNIFASSHHVYKSRVRITLKNGIVEKVIVVFILLIILIVSTIIFSYYKNKPLNNVDRKIEYIFNNITYDDALNMSKEVFNNALKLIKNDYEYEENNNEIVLYSINN